MTANIPTLTENPAKTTTKISAEIPTDTPTEISADTPIEISAEIPTDTLADILPDIPPPQIVPLTLFSRGNIHNFGRETMNYSMIYDIDNEELHRNLDEEINFFRAVANGDVPAIEDNIKRHRFRDESGVGKLSVDPVLNLKYHMVITAGMIARICIECGLDAELSFRMSDFYIKKLDHALTEDEVELIHDNMILDYTKQMNINQRNTKLSRTVSNGLDYIYGHIFDRITVKQIADHVGVSPSFLSRSFSAEVGITVSDFIRSKKIDISKNMLKNTDMSIPDISYRLSFASESHFIQCFRRIVGITPNVYRSISHKPKWM